MTTISNVSPQVKTIAEGIERYIPEADQAWKVLNAKLQGLDRHFESRGKVITYEGFQMWVIGLADHQVMCDRAARDWDKVGEMLAPSRTSCTLQEWNDALREAGAGLHAREWHVEPPKEYDCEPRDTPMRWKVQEIVEEQSAFPRRVHELLNPDLSY